MAIIGVIQMRSGVDVARNIETSSALIREAAAKGARLIFTPEMTSMLDKRPGEVQKKAQLEKDDIALQAYRSLAEELQITLQIGSLPIRNRSGVPANRGFCIGPDGRIICSYDKIHMFDVDLPDGQVIRESEKYAPGNQATIAQTEVGLVGITICYDVRFPTLYTDLATAGAQIITVPSAFTVSTGEAHWHTLLRARAIENGCFVVAAAQCGKHEDGRETYGHSLVVNPWGEVIAEAENEPVAIIVDIDLAEVELTRSRIPNLQNIRPYKKVKIFR